jgi:alginate O-acetyltransferase complex protein AlgJ
VSTNPEKKKTAAFGATSSALEAHAPTATPPSPPLTLGAWLFSLAIFLVPIAQLAYERAHGERMQVLDYLEPLRHGPEGRSLGRFARELALELASEPRLRRFESDLRNASFLKREALPGYQWLLTALFRHGNEKVVTGRDGWLFYADDLESAFGRGFLEPGVGADEALAAIDDFARQLEARGVKLLLIPSYSKEMLDPQMVSPLTRRLTSAVNPDLERFYAELDRRGHRCVRMDEIFDRARAAAPGEPLALPRDTHWTPRTMAFAAARIAERVRALLGEDASPAPANFTTRKVEIEGHGDLVRMLGLPKGQTLFPSMRLELEQVVDTLGTPTRPDATSDVLLMGDSLTKVFGDASLGLGGGAGLGEHLALRLGRPIDVIALAGGSATATREALARRGDPLANKKLVIWQFGVRMLAAGKGAWRLVDLSPHKVNPFGAPEPLDVSDVPLDRVTLVGEIVETSSTGPDFDYPFVLLVYEYKVVRVEEGKLDGDRVWVAFPAIVEGKSLEARGFKAGTRHRLVLDDLRLHFDIEQVPMFDETDAGRVLHYPLEWAPAR